MTFWAGVGQKLRTPVARVGLGLFALGTGAVALWPPATYVFDPGKALAFAAALGAWLFAELFPEVRGSFSKPAELDPHDTEFAKRFRGIASDDFIRFLDEHDFGGSFRDKAMSPAYELPDFLRKASSGFNDLKLQALLEIVQKEGDEFANMIALGSAPKNARMSLFTMIPENEPDGMWSDKTLAKVAAANRKADELSGAIKAVLRLLRQKGFVLAPETPADDSPAPGLGFVGLPAKEAE